MPARFWIAAFALAALILAVGFGWDAELFSPPPAPLVESPEAVAAGKEVFARRCVGCHRDVPLQRRVAGWSAERAYQTIGQLPSVPRAHMPPFPGDDEERRALAVFLAALGAGTVRPP